MDKKIIEYNIPIQDRKHIDDYYQMCKKLLGEDFKPTDEYLTTEEHVEVLIDKLHEAIVNIGEEYGFYIGDDIKVRIELEYQPESK